MDRVYNYVPCNKCPACLSNKRKDILVRALADSECFYNRDSLGNLKLHKTEMMFFFTLTYNNDHLPVAIFPNGIKRSVFSRRDIQLFFKKLQKELSKQGVVFHKMVACEYGSDSWYKDDRGRYRRATHRPHYHSILFLNKHLDPYYLQNLIKSTWNLCDWDKVRYPFGKHGTGELYSDGAIRYVSKYVTKFDNDRELFLTWLHSFDEKHLLDELQSSDKNSIPFDLLSSLFDVAVCKAGLPFFQTSMYFGLSLNDCKNIKVNWKELKVSYYDNIVNDYKRINLPAYYKNRFYYDTIKDFSGEFMYRIKFFDLSNIYNYKIDVVPGLITESRYSDEYLKYFENNISKFFTSSRQFLDSLCSTALGTPDKFSDLVNLSHFKFISQNSYGIAYYLLFNRGYQSFLSPSLGLNEAFTARYRTGVFEPYFDSSRLYVNYEECLDTLYDFQRILGMNQFEEWKLEAYKAKLLKNYMFNS